MIELSACAFHLPPGSERDTYWRGLEAAAAAFGLSSLKSTCGCPMRRLVSELMQLATIDNVDFACCTGPESHFFARKNIGALASCPFDGTALTTLSTLGGIIGFERTAAWYEPLREHMEAHGQQAPVSVYRRREPQRLHAGDSRS